VTHPRTTNQQSTLSNDVSSLNNDVLHSMAMLKIQQLEPAPPDLSRPFSSISKPATQGQLSLPRKLSQTVAGNREEERNKS